MEAAGLLQTILRTKYILYILDDDIENIGLIKFQTIKLTIKALTRKIFLTCLLFSSITLVLFTNIKYYYQ